MLDSKLFVYTSVSCAEIMIDQKKISFACYIDRRYPYIDFMKSSSDD